MSRSLRVVISRFLPAALMATMLAVGVGTTPSPVHAIQPGCAATHEDPAFYGDWNGDGIDGPGVRRGNTFLLRNSASLGGWDIAQSWGRPTDVPLVGDWDGDGVDTPGLKRGNTYILKLNNTPGSGASTTVTWGTASDIPIVGDWEGDGTDTLGTKAVTGNTYQLAADNSSSPGVFRTIAWGQATDDPVAGDWDDDGDDTLGLKRGDTWFLANENVAAPSQYQSFAYGTTCDTALAAVPTAGAATQVSVRQDRRIDVELRTFPRTWWIRGKGSFVYPRPVVLVDDAAIDRARTRYFSGDPTYQDSYLWTKAYAAYGETVTTAVPAVPPPAPQVPPAYTSAPSTGADGTAFWKAARPQAAMARDAALVFRIEGLAGYRDKAKEILLAWANPPTPYDPNFACSIPGTWHCSGAGMRISRTMISFTTAYTLLYDNFTVTERDTIDRWLLYMAARIEQSRHDFACWGGEDCGNYHGGERWQNHITAMSMGRLAIGLALDDAELIDDVLRSTSFPDNVRAVMNGVLLPACGANGQPTCAGLLAPSDPTLTGSAVNPQAGEIYDRYRVTYATKGVGLAYAGMQIGLLSLMAQMAHASRHDDTLFERDTPRGVSLQDAFEFYAPFWSYPHDCGNGEVPQALFGQRTGYYAADAADLFPLCPPNDISGYWELAYDKYGTPASKAVLCTSRGRISYQYEALGWTSPLLYGADLNC